MDAKQKLKKGQTFLRTLREVLEVDFSQQGVFIRQEEFYNYIDCVLYKKRLILKT